MPVVAVHTDRFARLAESTARSSGVPRLRQAYVPQPVVDKSPAELRAYIEGDDPVAGRPFTARLVDGLTAPLDEEERVGVAHARRSNRYLEAATDEALHRRFEEEHWTDFLPVVLPTTDRVDEMLAATSHHPDEVVGRLRPTAYRQEWEFSVEKVAVNAVMAGARPAYFPVILALAASGQTARQSSTNSFATLALVNGPIRHEIGMNSGVGAMGPYNHANATIGRAFGLLSQNLQGGSVPDDTYMGSQGNAYSYSAVWAENEEASPWEPFHVQHGFSAETSTVSVFLGGWYTGFGCGVRDSWEETFTRVLNGGDQFMGPLLILDPLAARSLVEVGFADKADLITWLAEHSLRTAREFWDNQWIQTLVRPRALNGEQPYASYLDADPDELIAAYTRDDVGVVVIGGETQPTWRTVAARHGGNTVSVDDWR